ncbi:hypothetical protein N7470_001465 [Penicillium chermesinum]|nr:hypothetical protein N7470_001465 [Penicillium chermesinum]
MTEKINETFKFADSDGHFRRKDSAFRSWISRDPAAELPAEKDRYVLYLNYGWRPGRTVPTSY